MQRIHNIAKVHLNIKMPRTEPRQNVVVSLCVCDSCLKSFSTTALNFLKLNSIQLGSFKELMLTS